MIESILLDASGRRWREVYENGRDDRQPTLAAGLRTLGWSRFTEARPGWLGVHAHDVYEICLIVGGAVEWELDNRLWEVRADEVFVTGPGEEHGRANSIMDACELYWLQIEPDALVPVLSASLGRLIARRHLAADPTLRHIVEGLLGEHRRTDALAALNARALLDRLLVTLVRSATLAADRTQRPLSEPIRRVVEGIRSDPGRALSVAAMAAAAGLRPSQFQQRFLAETGLTPRRFRERERVQAAKRRLRQLKTSVTEVALELGFCSSQHFSTAFRRVVGVTPSRYRSSQRG